MIPGIEHDTHTVPKPIAVRVSEACRMTGIGKTKLCALIAAGDLVKIKIGGGAMMPRGPVETTIALIRPVGEEVRIASGLIIRGILKLAQNLSGDPNASLAIPYI